MGFSRIINMFKNIKNWNEYLLDKISSKKSPAFVFRLRNDFSVSVPRQIMPEFKENMFEQMYFKKLPAAVYRIDKPIIIDIGANVGYFTIFCLSQLKNSKIIAFEPMKRNFAVLSQNLSTINSNPPLIVNKAVNDTTGSLILKFNNSMSITTSASLFDNSYGMDEEVVETTTLEDIFSGYQLPRIDVLKLDCEGAEYNIIYNTNKNVFAKVNCLALETHKGRSDRESTSALANNISALGFTVKTEKDFIWAYKHPAKWVR